MVVDMRCASPDEVVVGVSSGKAGCCISLGREVVGASLGVVVRCVPVMIKVLTVRINSSPCCCSVDSSFHGFSAPPSSRL